MPEESRRTGRRVVRVEEAAVRPEEGVGLGYVEGCRWVKNGGCKMDSVEED